VSADVHFLTDPADPRLADYRDLKDRARRAAGDSFIAESEPVVRKLIESGLPVRSILLTAPHLTHLEAVLPAGVPVYVAPQAVLDQVAGFHVHRGCLAVGQRPFAPEVPAHAHTVVVLEDLVDVDNVGAAIRNAAAFDAGAVVLSPRCADPFYRKAIRVSMATVFFLPVVRCQTWPQDLLRLRQSHSLSVVGAVLDPQAVPLSSFTWPERVALLVGAEGPGLSPAARAACDHLVTIPMARAKADSLNVATATGIFLHARACRATPPIRT
jgi:tRNA G18 (ribose-2'-O)-methylase SpoU